MSTLTKCNHCTYHDIRRAHPDAKIELRPHDRWIACYVDGEKVAMFLELTQDCAC